MKSSTPENSLSQPKILPLNTKLEYHMHSEF
jgi:hypothetical protein